VAELFGTSLLQRLLVERPRPDRIRKWPKAPWLAVAAVCVGAFMGQLDASIVTVAIPSLRHELHASLGAVEWVSLGYLLVLVCTVPVIGRLADTVGRKLLYTYGFAVFTLASLGCGLAPNLSVLLAMRVVQALGAAMLQANSVALIRTTVRADQLTRALGLQGAAQALGLAAGPALGGVLIGLAGWRWVFYANVPAGAVGALLGVLLLPRTRVRSPRGRGPFVDLAVFRSRAFSAGLAGALLAYLVLFGTLFVTPLYLEAEFHLAPSAAGLTITVLPVCLGLLAALGGRVAVRRRAPAGMTLACAGLAVAAFTAGSRLPLIGALALIGSGLGLFIPANSATVAGAGPERLAGMVGGLLNMTRGIGTSLGVAVAGATYALAGADGRPGFRITMAALAAFAAVAAVLPGIGGRRDAA
jgi:MFS family permease